MSDALRISCEFSPPRTDRAAHNLRGARRRLQRLQPDFFSVTYGAGGSTREGTRNAVLEIVQDGLAAAPHLSHSGSDADLIDMLERYREAGIRRVVALRGYRPSGFGPGDGLVYGSQVVTLIREHYGDHFHIEVACYPEVHPDSRSPADDLHWFKVKVDAGADSAITQYFYNADAYFDFVDRCRAAGITIPIVPGVMPITNFQRLVQFSDRCSAEIPQWLRRRLSELDGDTEALRAFGVDVVTALCERLIAGGAPGLHFYTLNQSRATLAIAANLGLLGDDG